MKKDIWDYHKDGCWVVIPTNTQTKEVYTPCGSDFYAIMGAGLAKQAATKFPGLSKRYGFQLGNGKLSLVDYTSKTLCIPTKEDWRNPSTLPLIRRAVGMLKQISHKIDGIIVVPPLGCGLGGLNWSDVKPLLDTLPKDRFVILPPEGG